MTERSARRRQRYTPSACIALESFLGDVVPEVHYIMPRTNICNECYAVLFKHETQNFCCNNGHVKLPDWTPPHSFIKELFLNDDARSKEFFKNIRAYNSLFSFVSLGVQLDPRLLGSEHRGPYYFSIQGSLYHRLGSLIPAEGSDPQYVQIYFFDSDFNKQLDRRASIFSGLDRNVISGIQEALNQTHPYIQFLKSAREKWNGNDVLSIKLIDQRSQRDKRYSQPTVSEVAIIMTDSSTSESESHRDIILTTRQDELKKIDELNAAYDCLAYPLFGGNSGFQLSLPREHGNGHVTIRQFYAYRLQERSSVTNLLLYGRRLLHQYVVDQYAKEEQNALKYIRYHQKDFRADSYQGVIDSMVQDTTSARNIGRRIILPSTFTGSPRHMNQLFQDSLSIVKKYGKPDIFITVTCNPHWKEITDELAAGQRPEDRPDIVARVFNMKLKEIKKDLLENGVFGKVVAYMDVIQFQKRGLPHAHILLILDTPSKPRTVDAINKIVSAEIPNSTTQKILFDSVTRHMIHGPCGSFNPDAPCMKDGICMKGFPKVLCQETSLSENAYPLYCRRPNRDTIQRSGTTVGNEWIVPYNPYMCQKYNAHINVEICSGIAAVKYLYKYMYRGIDRATIEVDNDEVKQYIDGRYLSASEACWRLFAFKLHSHSHAVYRLPVHLPNQQCIHFTDEDDVSNVLQETKDTMLTKFFTLCQSSDFARTLLYLEVPVYYKWDKTLKLWLLRDCHFKTIGRMYTAHPSDSERFYLRMLLSHVHGPTSYDYLRTYENIMYRTFKEAAVARGLLSDDLEWNRTLSEASLNCHPYQIRELFAVLLLNCPIKNPKSLFVDFFPIMAEDFAHQHSIQRENIQIENGMLLAQVATEISKHLQQENQQSWVSFCLPPFDETLANIHSSCADENMVDYSYDYRLLNNDQRAVFDEVIRALEERSIHGNSLFYIDGPGGSGKTYLNNAILTYARSHNHKALAVASTGIASMLLLGGNTAHSQFEIPIELSEQSTCNVTKQSKLARLLQQVDLIIWDEAPMTHRYAFEALDRTLRDLRNSQEPMGGIVTVLCGDFRQVLPIVANSSRADIVHSTLRNSVLWKHIKHIALSKNMRLNTCSSSAEWDQCLRQIGNGQYPSEIVNEQDCIRLPDEILLAPNSTINDLMSSVYGQDYDALDEANLQNKIILTPQNKNAQKINDAMTKRIPGDAKTYKSADSTCSSENVNACVFPDEFLNSLNPSGIPPHELTLKVGIPIILIRSIAPKAGLYNGTRLRIDSLQQFVVTATILSGTCIGKQVKIPRIDFYFKQAQLPFTLIRRQFPFLIAFALTINRSQGQSFENVGIYLPSPVFSHGQLYVALSRCKSMEKIKVLIQHDPSDHKHTKNIVYQEVLQ